MRRTILASGSSVAVILMMLGPSIAFAQDASRPASDAPVSTPAPPVVPVGRSEENAVRQAADAFGVTIGRETIGIYSAGNVRGFSPLAAGNARIDGLYFDVAASPNSRVRRSTSIKVGLSALGYYFPAPTGVVDYALRRPGVSPLLSATLSGDNYGDAGLELDAEIPIVGERLAFGGGFGVYAHRYHNGSTSRQDVQGVTLHWRPSPQIEVVPFWGRSYIEDSEVDLLLSTAGDYLPARVRRDLSYSPRWADYSGYALAYGVVASARFGSDWRIEAGAFSSASGAREDSFTFLSDITPGGAANFAVFSDPPYRRRSASGEVRVSRALADGPRSHVLAASFRARDRRERAGGSAFVDFGEVRFGEPLRFPEPSFTFGERNDDQVRQWTAGGAYVGRWSDVGELSAGLSIADYRKRFDRPGRPIAETRDRPWLYNIAGALYVTSRLAVYGGYTRGLEETGLPPPNALNRNQALPAILTSQQEAGFRWNVAGLKLVAGVFDVRKPYLSLDATNVFTTLGDTRNRGVEASFSGEPLRGLSVALGGVLLDPQVVGEARALGRAGRRPVGVPLRSIDLNLDWRLPGLDGFSIDAGISEQGRVASTVSNSLFIPSRTLVSLGGRYRFAMKGTRTVLRISALNLLDQYGYDYAGPSTFQLVPSRQVSAYLAVDL